MKSNRINPPYLLFSQDNLLFQLFLEMVSSSNKDNFITHVASTSFPGPLPGFFWWGMKIPVKPLGAAVDVSKIRITGLAIFRPNWDF